LIVDFKDSEKQLILKHLCFLPLFSMIAGILLMPTGLFNPFQRGNYIGLAGVSSSTNLAFYGVVAIMSASYLYKLNGKLAKF
jgi:hypothetical protein